MPTEVISAAGTRSDNPSGAFLYRNDRVRFRQTITFIESIGASVGASLHLVLFGVDLQDLEADSDLKAPSPRRRL